MLYTHTSMDTYNLNTQTGGSDCFVRKVKNLVSETAKCCFLLDEYGRATTTMYETCDIGAVSVLDEFAGQAGAICDSLVTGLNELQELNVSSLDLSFYVVFWLCVCEYV